MIKVSEFINLLIKSYVNSHNQSELSKYFSSPDALGIINIIRYGRNKGWLEDSDERYPDWEIDKKTAARIVHEFLRIEGHIQDVVDITKAKKLKDLYLCRVCANHIAQVYERGIIKAQTNDKFGLLDKISDEEANQIVENVNSLLKTQNN